MRQSEPNQASVAIITRTIPGREIFLDRVIQSVLSQSFEDYIHVIVVDSPNVGEIETVMKKYRKKYGERILVMHTGRKDNMEAASNRGIQESISKYVTILDDDDTWEKEFLERTVDFLEKNKDPMIKGVVTDSRRIYEHLENRSIVFEKSEPFKRTQECVWFYRVLGENMFPVNSFLYERAVIDKIGYYDESLPVLGDWDFNIRFLSSFDIGYISEELANYHVRFSDNSVVGNTVTAKLNTHFLYSAKIRNKYFRNDIEVNKMGLGFAMANSADSYHVLQRLDSLDKKVVDIQKRVNSFDAFINEIRRTLPYLFLKKIRGIFQKINRRVQ